MGTSWNRIGVLILLVLCSSYGVTVKTDSLQVRQNAQVDGKLKVGNTPKPVATDSVLTKLPDGTIGLWPISAISTDTSFTDSSLWADSSRASYKSDTTAGAMRLGGKTLSQIDTIGHGAIKQSIRDTASNKLWIHGKADSSVLADSVKKNLAISKITGLSDSLANKLPLHGIADSAKGARYLGGKTKTYYDTVGNGGMNAAIALKLNISDTSIFSRDGHGHDTGDLSGLPNFDYFVQGNASTRTTDAGDTDVDSYSQSGFYRATSAAPHTPTGAGYGIIHTNHASTSSAFQLASRWSSNNLYYRRKNSSTWEPWVELYHTGNFNPNDYVSTTDPRLSDARTPTAHANTHFYTGSDAIKNATFGLYPVASGDPWYVGLSYGGIGFGSTEGVNRQMVAITDAGANNQPVFSITTSLNSGSTWENVFNIDRRGNTNISGGLNVTGLFNLGTSMMMAGGIGHPTQSASITFLNDLTSIEGISGININTETGTINLQDNTNVTGNLTVTGTINGNVNPASHAATHLYGGSDAIVGNEGFGLRAVATDDVWSVGGGLGHHGIGIISNSGVWRQAITFTDASADSHPVFSIITSKNNGSTWSNVFNVTSSGSGIFKGDITAASMHVGTNEVWHAGNFNPADYTTTAQLQDWSTNILANQLESYNAAEFTTVYNDYCDNIRLVKKGLTSLQNGYAGSIAFGARGANTRHAAIAAKQTGSDANQVGLAFFTHPQTSISTTYPMVEKMVLDHNGTLSVGGDLIVGDKLTLAVDGSGHATVSTKEYGDDIKIKTGGNGSVIDMKDLSTSISSRDVTVSSSYQTKVKSSGTVNIEGGSGITLDCTDSNSAITANKRTYIYANLEVGSTNPSPPESRALRVLAPDLYNAGFEAHGGSQGTGYLYVGRSSSTGGGIYYNGDGNPTFASGEFADRVTFYRRTSNSNYAVFYYPNNTNNVTFLGAVTSQDAITSAGNITAQGQMFVNGEIYNTGTSALTLMGYNSGTPGVDFPLIAITKDPSSGIVLNGTPTGTVVISGERIGINAPEILKASPTTIVFGSSNYNLTVTKPRYKIQAGSCNYKVIMQPGEDGQRVTFSRINGSGPICARVWYGKVSANALDSGTVNIAPGHAQSFIYDADFGGWLMEGGN